MEMVKCETCGKEFNNTHALKIHNARAHALKLAPATKTSKKVKKSAKNSKAATFTCETCGRGFKMAGHLARHVIMTHGKPSKAKNAGKVAKPVGRPVAPVVSTGVDVLALSVDQLLAVKQQVDARLADIVQMMRAAKVAL